MVVGLILHHQQTVVQGAGGMTHLLII